MILSMRVYQLPIIVKKKKNNNDIFFGKRSTELRYRLQYITININMPTSHGIY